SQELDVLRIGERVLPVLDLRITREKEPRPLDLEDEDEARVVHLLIESAHDPEERLSADRADMIAQPPGMGWNACAIDLVLVRERCPAGGRELRARGTQEHPELDVVGATHLADGV